VPVIIKHAKTGTIADWTQADLDQQIAAGNYPPGTVLADIVLPSDWNNDHTLTGLGTMAEQDATAVAITGGTINNTTIGATTATTGKFTSVTTPSVTATVGDLNLSPIGGGNLYLNQSQTGAFGTIVARDVGQASLSSRLFFDSSLGVSSIRNNGGNNLSFSTGATIGTTSGVVQQSVTHTASAVNYVQVTGAATGNAAGPLITAQGSDASVPLSLQSKLNSPINFFTSGGFQQFRVNNLVNAVNYLQVQGSVAGNATPLSAIGNDTNISMAFQPKGTGAIDLAAGSSGVNISNGGTVTAITRTAVGNNYTTNPTVAISAPTTAGGVQATATVPIGVASFTVSNGGTGYAVGNVLTMVGGTFTSAGTCTVSAVSGGVITAVTATSTGTYTAAPTNPASVTGGAGTGATFTLNFGVLSTFTITNAGSGYIEQPTITFSGGGGSGAAAYASIGNTTTIKGLYGGASQIPIQFAGPSGNLLQIMETGSTSSPVPLVVKCGASSSQLYPNGSNIPLQFSSSGTGALNFYTNTLAQEQLRVAHTASAVNYVQVTGSATGGVPLILAQGSDTNVNIATASKGTGYLAFRTNTSTEQFRVYNTTSAVNRIEITGSIASSAPLIKSEGTDTNIDLALTPKGTGLVRFGTYVAGALLATGYINIKAADGTTYKVLVST